MPDATQPSFIDVDLRDRSFAGQDLSGAVFRGADLRGVDFSKSKLIGATFEGCRTGISPSQKAIAPLVAAVALVILLPIGAIWGTDIIDPHRQATVASDSADKAVWGFLIGSIVVVGGLIGFWAEKLTKLRGLSMLGIAGGGVGAGLGFFAVAVYYVVQAFTHKQVVAGIIRLLVALIPLGFLAICAYVGNSLYRDRTGTDFAEADLMQAQFQTMRLQNCNFASANLKATDWADSEFVRCEFKDSNNKIVDRPPPPLSPD